MGGAALWLLPVTLPREGDLNFPRGINWFSGSSAKSPIVLSQAEVCLLIRSGLL